MAKKFHFDTVGIPLKDVGERLQILNESLKEHGILLQRDIGAHIEIAEVKGEDLAVSVTITATLFKEAK